MVNDESDRREEVMDRVEEPVKVPKEGKERYQTRI